MQGVASCGFYGRLQLSGHEESFGWMDRLRKKRRKVSRSNKINDDGIRRERKCAKENNSQCLLLRLDDIDGIFSSRNPCWRCYSDHLQWNQAFELPQLRWVKHTSLPLPGLKLTMVLMCHLCEAFFHFSPYIPVLLGKIAEFLSAAEHETKTKWHQIHIFLTLRRLV